jgi:hypothetical protein
MRVPVVSRTTRIVGIILLLVVGIAVARFTLFGSIHFEPLRTSDPEKEFELLMAQEVQRWQEVTAPALARECQRRIDAAVEAMKKKWRSSERLDAFVEELFGYFKGWKLLWLSGKDLFSDGRPAVEAELSDMMQRLILFDVSPDLEQLRLDLEGLVEEKAQEHAQRLSKALQKRISPEELLQILKVRIPEDAALGSMTTTTATTVTGHVLEKIGVLFAARIGTVKLVKGMAVPTLGGVLGPVITAVASKTAALFASKAVSAITGVVLVALIDWAAGKASEAYFGPKIKEELVKATDDMAKGLRALLLQGVRESFAGLSPGTTAVAASGQ